MIRDMLRFGGTHHAVGHLYSVNYKALPGTYSIDPSTQHRLSCPPSVNGKSHGLVELNYLESSL